MIVCHIGTRAQLIKMAPVMLELERRQLPFVFVLTGQHCETMDELIADFAILTPPVKLYAGAEITGIAQMSRWFFLVLQKSIRLIKPYTKTQSNILLVHGDTASTLVGALTAKWLRIPLHHVEGGLRSHHWFDPFPEEMIRVLVGRMADVAYCPGEWAAGNAGNYGGRVVNTATNTITDALELVLHRENGVNHDLLATQPYCVVSIHRFENIFKPKRLHQVVEMVNVLAKDCPVIFVLHPATKKRLEMAGLFDTLAKNPAITLKPRMSYSRFIALAAKAQFVVTDGGGNQEELAYLAIPTIVARKVSERKDGLGSTTIINNLDPNGIRQFLAKVAAGRPSSADKIPSPARTIVDFIAASP